MNAEKRKRREIRKKLHPLHPSIFQLDVSVLVFRKLVFRSRRSRSLFLSSIGSPLCSLLSVPLLFWTFTGYRQSVHPVAPFSSVPDNTPHAWHRYTFMPLSSRTRCSAVPYAVASAALYAGVTVYYGMQSSFDREVRQISVLIHHYYCNYALMIMTPDCLRDDSYCYQLKKKSVR